MSQLPHNARRFASDPVQIVVRIAFARWKLGNGRLADEVMGVIERVMPGVITMDDFHRKYREIDLCLLDERASERERFLLHHLNTWYQLVCAKEDLAQAIKEHVPDDDWSVEVFACPPNSLDEGV